jgi:transposase-like protein
VKITDDIGQLLAFHDYPSQHWIHRRTTSPIESTFATVRHRTKVTKGSGSSVTEAIWRDMQEFEGYRATT